MSTSKKLDEITELVILLQNSHRGVTIDEMKEKLERPRRAIERLMEVIREKYGERLYYINHDTDTKKHWIIKKDNESYFINLSEIEMQRLKKFSNSIKNDAERKNITEILNKINILNTGKNNKRNIDILLEAQGYAVRQYAESDLNQKFMEKLAYAIQSMQKIKLKYKDFKGYESEPVLEPYGIKIADKHYLIAGINIKEKENFSDINDYFRQFLTYKISRIEDIEVLEGEYFDRDEGFDIQEYCNRSFGVYTGEVEEIVINFLPAVAGYVSNYRFHPTQKGKFNDDGSYTLTFNASGHYEIITELLKWREGVNIIKPLSLKEEYKETVRLMYENTMKG